MASTCALPQPEILDCFFDTSAEPHLLAMHLRWHGSHGQPRQAWQLPHRERVSGDLPRQFGIEVHRHAEDAYDVQLLWDQHRLHWVALSREEILKSDLVNVLAALRTDMQFLLNQPVASV